MTRTGVIVLLVCAAIAGSACTRTNDGVPIAAGGQDRAARTSETVSPDPRADDPVPGVVSTAPAPAGSICAPAGLPPVATVAQVSDPGAPTATVAVPDGWSMSSANGDPEGARLEGPEGMEAIVTITPTPLDPAAAFREYTDLLTRDATVSTVSVLPGEMCGYSGQKLMGVLSDGAQSVQYQDRIVHVGVPTGTTDQAYLIVVHVEAPTGNPGFDTAASVLTDVFEIGLP